MLRIMKFFSWNFYKSLMSSESHKNLLTCLLMPFISSLTSQFGSASSNPHLAMKTDPQTIQPKLDANPFGLSPLNRWPSSIQRYSITIHPSRRKLFSRSSLNISLKRFSFILCESPISMSILRHSQLECIFHSRENKAAKTLPSLNVHLRRRKAGKAANKHRFGCRWEASEAKLVCNLI